MSDLKRLLIEKIGNSLSDGELITQRISPDESEILRIYTLADGESCNPRDADRIGIFCSFEEGWGDFDPNTDTLATDEERLAHINSVALLKIPVYTYKHNGGIDMQTSPYADVYGVDVSQPTGVVYTTQERLDFLGVDDQSIEKLKEYLLSEVHYYNLFLTGQCVGFDVLRKVDDCPADRLLFETDTTEVGFLGTEGVTEILNNHAAVDWREVVPSQNIEHVTKKISAELDSAGIGQ